MGKDRKPDTTASPAQDLLAFDLGAFLVRHRRRIAWSAIAICTVSLLFAIKEVTTLLILAYIIALLINPILERFERLGVSRSTSIILGGVALLILLIGLLVVAIPLLIREYAHFIGVLPSYLKMAAIKFADFLERDLGISLPESSLELWDSLPEFFSVFSVEQLKVAARGLGRTVLSGYSLTLTVLNAILLPFFVYYIARDLKELHGFVAYYVGEPLSSKVAKVGSEILDYVYAFFEGQITVGLIMALGYSFGLYLLGLPYAVTVGILAGVLNVVPYLGVSLGVVLATIIALVNGFTFLKVGMVMGVFVVVQILEGTVLTPKIVGEKVGIHPLVIMVALVIGGNLLGLLGLVMAVPAAAAVRVILNQLSLAPVQARKSKRSSVTTNN